MSGAHCESRFSNTLAQCMPNASHTVLQPVPSVNTSSQRAACLLQTCQSRPFGTAHSAGGSEPVSDAVGTSGGFAGGPAGAGLAGSPSSLPALLVAGGGEALADVVFDEAEADGAAVARGLTAEPVGGEPVEDALRGSVCCCSVLIEELSGDGALSPQPRVPSSAAVDSPNGRARRVVVARWGKRRMAFNAPAVPFDQFVVLVRQGVMTPGRLRRRSPGLAWPDCDPSTALPGVAMMRWSFTGAK